MKTQKVGTRGVLFTFEEPYRTNVFFIDGERHVFVCDTFLGSEPAEKIKQYIAEKKIGAKPVIVFNSHGDYDHYWGNGSFRSSIILGHELCGKKIEKEATQDLKDFQNHKLGNVEIVPPNVTFNEKVFFVEEGVEFYFTPGHTEDSCSCFDHIDRTLFVGDNVESPIPHINELNVTAYISTLEEYLERRAKTIVAGHDGIMLDDRLVRSNMEYLRRFEALEADPAKFDKKGKIVHFWNLSNISEKLREKGMLKKALKRYEESKCVLDQLDDSTQGKQEQMKRIQERIDIISEENAKKPWASHKC